MNNKDFIKIYKEYNEFNTFIDRLNFCMDVLKPTNCFVISKELDIPVSTVTRIKKGTIQNPNPVYLYAIASFLGVTYEWLVESKYFPIDQKDYLKKCICNDSESDDAFLEIESKKTLPLAFNDLNEYNQAIKAFPLYKDLIPEFINYLVKKGYLEKVMDNNISQILNKIEENKKEIQVDNNNESSLKQLAKEKRNSKNVNISEIREKVNKISKSKDK